MSSTLKALSRVEELLRPLDVPNSRYYFLQRLDRLQDLCKAPKKIALKTEMADAEKTKLRTATESLAKEVTAYLTTQQPQWVSVVRAFVERSEHYFTKELLVVKSKWDRNPSATFEYTNTMHQDFLGLRGAVASAKTDMASLEKKTEEFIAFLRKDEFDRFADIGPGPSLQFLDQNAASVYNYPYPWLPDGGGFSTPLRFMQQVSTASKHVSSYLEATLQLYNLAFATPLAELAKGAEELDESMLTSKVAGGDGQLKSRLDEIFVAFQMIKTWANSVIGIKAIERWPCTGRVSSLDFIFPVKPDPNVWVSDPAWNKPYFSEPQVVYGISGLDYESSQPVTLDNSVSNVDVSNFHLEMEVSGTSARRNATIAWLVWRAGDPRFDVGSIWNLSTDTAGEGSWNPQREVKVRFRRHFGKDKIPKVVIYLVSINARSKAQDTDWCVWPEVVQGSITNQGFTVKLSDETVNKTLVTNCGIGYIAMDETTSGVECGMRRENVHNPSIIKQSLTESKFPGRTPSIFWSLNGFTCDAKEKLFVYSLCSDRSISKKMLDINVTIRSGQTTRVGVTWLAIDNNFGGT